MITVDKFVWHCDKKGCPRFELNDTDYNPPDGWVVHTMNDDMDEVHFCSEDCYHKFFNHPPAEKEIKP